MLKRLSTMCCRLMKKTSRLILHVSHSTGKSHAMSLMMAAKHLRCVPSDLSTLTDEGMIRFHGTGQGHILTDRRSTSMTLTQLFSTAHHHIGANAKTDWQISRSICRRESCWHRISCSASSTCFARCSWIHTLKSTRCFSTRLMSSFCRSLTTFTTGFSFSSRACSTNLEPTYSARCMERSGRHWHWSMNTSRQIYRCKACSKSSQIPRKRQTWKRSTPASNSWLH